MFDEGDGQHFGMYDGNYIEWNEIRFSHLNTKEGYILTRHEFGNFAFLWTGEAYADSAGILLTSLVEHFDFSILLNAIHVW